MNVFHSYAMSTTGRALLLLLASFAFCCVASAQAQVDLSVQKTGPESAAPDSNVTFQIIVANQGPDDAPNATVKDVLPAGLTFVSLNSPSGWNCNVPAIGTNGTVVCTHPNLTVNDSEQSFTLVTHTDSGAASGSFISNKASVSSDTFDITDENDESTASVQISATGTTTDLGILVASDHESATIDTDVTYQISLTNSSQASNVSLTDPIPGGMTFSKVTPPSAQWTCTHPNPGGTGTVSCSISSLEPAITTPLVFSLTFHIPATAAEGDVAADDVRTVPNLTAITQVTFRLPDDLPADQCALTIKFRSLISNQAVIRIK